MEHSYHGKNFLTHEVISRIFMKAFIKIREITEDIQNDCMKFQFHIDLSKGLTCLNACVRKTAGNNTYLTKSSKFLRENKKTVCCMSSHFWQKTVFCVSSHYWPRLSYPLAKIISKFQDVFHLFMSTFSLKILLMIDLKKNQN